MTYYFIFVYYDILLWRWAVPTTSHFYNPRSSRSDLKRRCTLDRHPSRYLKSIFSVVISLPRVHIHSLYVAIRRFDKL